MWILIALMAPAFYAMTNVIDKYMVHHYQKDISPGALVFYMGIFSVVALPFLCVLFPAAFRLSFHQGALITITGIITTLAWVPYMYALETEDMSAVLPLYQLRPVLTFTAAYFILQESLSQNQILGGIIIILGAIILTKDPTKKWGIKMNTINLIIISSLCLVAVEILFKGTVQNITYTSTLFWFFLGHVIAALLLLLIPNYRKEILTFSKNAHPRFIRLMALNESIGLIADICNMYAILLAPIALVNAIGGFQSAFVFVYGTVITLFFPRILREDLSRNNIVRKITAIIIMLAGSFIMTLY